MTETRRTIAFAIVAAALIGITSAPMALAHSGTVENYYWHNDTRMCYDSSSLDNMTVDGSTNNSSDVETEVDKSKDTFNNEMNQVTLLDDAWGCWLGDHVDVASANHANSNVLGWEVTHLDWFDNTEIDQSEVRFNTDQDWGTNSNSCSVSDLDIEWIMNHELGHSIGLKHHNHPSSPNSMMYEYCDSKYAALQTVDDTAIDINYS